MLKGCLLVLSTTHHTNIPTKPARASPVANSETPGTFWSCKITRKIMLVYTVMLIVAQALTQLTARELKTTQKK